MSKDTTKKEAVKEEKKLVKRAVNPLLEEEENYKRVSRLIKSISRAAKAKEEAGRYLEKNGTLKGYRGTDLLNMTIEDFNDAVGDNPEDVLNEDENQSGVNDLAPSQPRGQMVTVTNGRETLQIPIEDLAEAQSEGYRRVQ